MSYKLLIIFFIFNLYLFQNVFSKRRFKYEFYNFTCQMFDKRMKTIDCDFVKFNDEHFAFTETIIFAKEFGNEFKVRLWIDIKQKLLQKYLRFIDIKFDACSALNKNFEQPVVKTIMAEYRRTTNLPLNCPFKSNFLYKMDNYSFTTDDLPAYTPECNFIVGLDFYDVHTLFSSTKIIGAIINK